MTRIGIGGNNFTHTGTFLNDAWTGMNWWQWDPNAPNGATPGIGWDANGDWVCHAGWGSRILRCGSITNRFFIQNSGAEDIFPGHNATFVNQRQTTADGCQGDSGGTFYRNNDRTIAGLASRQFGTPSYTRHGNTCRPNTQYGHISYLKSVFGFTAPVNMS